MDKKILDDIEKQYNVAKQEYYSAKINQGGILRKYLYDEGFELSSNRLLYGAKNYKSGNRLDEEYDLRYWQYIVLKRKSVNFLISLQAFDQDPKTGNHHVLPDQVGIYAYVGSYSHEDAFKNMMMTNITLPFTEEKLVKLKTIIEDLSNCEIFRVQADFQEICNKHHIFTPGIY